MKTPHDATTPTTRVPVCALGASAGGLAPLEEMVGAFAADPRFAIVIVQHLSPSYESMMVQLLGPKTEIPVVMAEDGLRVEPATVYVLQPGDELLLDGDLLRVRERRKIVGEPQRPIDLFFTSMAEHRGASCCAAVLSGTGSDGTLGVERVYNAGGLTLVQDGSAAFNGMPSAALESGFVHGEMPPAELARAIEAFFSTGHKPADDGLLSASLTHDERTIASIASRESGIDFDDYKSSTIKRRIQRQLSLSKLPDLTQYASFVTNDEAARRQLVEDLTIDVTSFFRDPGAFAMLEADIIPGLIADAAQHSNSVRAWCPGTGTGEEAYSIAMLLLEAAAEHSEPVRVQVFATDVLPQAIDHAQLGSYEPARLAGVNPERRERWFDMVDGRYQANEMLRSSVTFAVHNLLTDAPFNKIDLVSCRNLLVYLKPRAHDRAVELISFALRRGGVLLLGSSESVGLAAPSYTPVSDAWRLYRKHSDRERKSGGGLEMALPTASRPAGAPPDRVLFSAYDALLESQFSGGLLIDTKHHILHVMGRGAEWLTLPVGRPSTRLADMVADTVVRLTMSSILRDLESGMAQTEPRPFSTSKGQDTTQVLCGRRLTTSSTPLYVVYSMPVEAPVSGPVPWIPARDAASAVGDAQGVAAPEAGEVELTLRAELAQAHESLRIAVGEQEANAEQLRSTNEELQSMNIELRTSNEELSSVNEELQTLNDENQRRLNQVIDLSADLDELMAQIDVAVILLESDRTVRRFNEPARQYFRIRESDIGRQFGDLTHRLDHAGLDDDVDRALADGTTASRIIGTQGDTPRVLSLRVERYDQLRDRRGVFVAIVDITELELSQRERTFARFFENAPFLIGVWDKHERMLFTNADRELPRPLLQGSTLGEIFPPDEVQEIREENQRILETGEPIVVLRTSAATNLSFVSQKFPLDIDGERHVGWLSITSDDARSLQAIAPNNTERERPGSDPAWKQLRAQRDRILVLEAQLTDAGIDSTEPEALHPIDLTDGG